MNVDDQLQRDLEALRGEVTFPSTPDFAGRIAESLPSPGGHTRPRRGNAFGRLSRPPTVFAVVALLFLLAVVATMAIPPARESVARWLHIDLPGIRIERVHDGDGGTKPLPSSLGGSLLLGTPVSLGEANDLLSSPLLAPSTTLVGEPMEIWQRNDGETISLLYPPSAQLPEIGETGVAMLLMRVQPESNDTQFFVKKSFGVEPVVSVSIGGREGWWIVDGQLTVQPEGVFPPVTRTSGHVLIWWDGNDVAWRMESALPKDEAIRIASSLVPLQMDTGNRRAVGAVLGVLAGALDRPATDPLAWTKEVSHVPSHCRVACRPVVARSRRSRRGWRVWRGAAGLAP